MDYLLTRLACAFLTGGIISITGSFLQLATRNMLASPSTLGVDGLAVLWLLVFHSVMIFFKAEFSIYQIILLGLPFFTLIGFVFSNFLKGTKRFEKTILLGITFNLFVGAIFSLWQFMFLAFNLPFPVELWFGHFRFASSESLPLLFFVELIFILGIFFLKKEILLFSMGTRFADHWKLNSRPLYSFLFISISVGTFVVITLFGAFSFLGLIFPLIARKWWFKKSDLLGEFYWGSLMNGLFLMLIDFICFQFPVWGAEIPVGLLVTAIGALSLIFLLWHSHAREPLAKLDK